MKTKEIRVSVRISPALKKRLNDAVERSGVEEPTIIRQCVEAFCAHVEMHGRITFPLTIGGQCASPPDSSSRFQLNEPKPKSK